MARAETSGRPDDADPAVIQKRIDVYNAETAPVASHYAAQGKFTGVDGIGTIEEITERLQGLSDSYMAEKGTRFGPEIMRMAEKSLLLQVLDQQWKEHLLQLEQLRQGINLRAYAQKDPLNEYKREAFIMFEAMLTTMRQTVTMALSHVELREPDEELASLEAAPAAAPTGKVPRNAPCPCGSGKKYKHCHGKI